MWTPLADTLIELVRAVTPPPGTGLTVTEAEIDIPLEIKAVTQGSEIVLYGTPPHTRWKSGVMPAVHLGHLKVELISSGDWEEGPGAG
jgi:hypothetical protein